MDGDQYRQDDSAEKKWRQPWQVDRLRADPIRCWLGRSVFSSLTSAWILMVSSHMPPVPPANRSKKGPGSDPEMSKDTSAKQPEHHHNAAEERERRPTLSRTQRTRASSG